MVTVMVRVMDKVWYNSVHLSCPQVIFKSYGTNVPFDGEWLCLCVCACE